MLEILRHEEQQGFPQPYPKGRVIPTADRGGTEDESSDHESEEWFDVSETLMDLEKTDIGRELEPTIRWESFPKTLVSFEEPVETTEPIRPVLAPHEMEQQFREECWEEIHFVF